MDWTILNWIQENLRNDFLDQLMTGITTLGNGGAIWLGAGGAMVCTKKYRNDGFTLIGGILLGVIVGNLTLKNIIRRPRPCWLNRSVELLIPMPQDFSFPSGHTLSSCIAATILTACNPKFAYGAVPLAILISFSRLYLYVHFPSDVAAGIVLGAALGLFCSYQKKRICARNIALN